MKKKYRFEFKDGTKKIYELTENQRNVFSVEEGFYRCREQCGTCKFNSSCCNDEIPLYRVKAITEEKGDSYEARYGTKPKEESTEFNSIYELYAYLSVEGNAVAPSDELEDIQDLKEIHRRGTSVEYDKWEKVIPKKEPKTKKVKLLAWLIHGRLVFQDESACFTLAQLKTIKRIPSEDKEVEVKV